MANANHMNATSADLGSVTAVVEGYCVMARGFKPVDQELGWTASIELGDIIEVDFGHRTGWGLVAEYQVGEALLWIVVADPVSYRVHDERELVHYWNRRLEEGVPGALVYEIAESAYLDEMSLGVSATIGEKLRHFLVGGENLCLEVIAREPPLVCRERPSVRNGYISVSP